jgi:hypothetical protein
MKKRKRKKTDTIKASDFMTPTPFEVSGILVGGEAGGFVVVPDAADEHLPRVTICFPAYAEGVIQGPTAKPRSRKRDK